MSLLCIWVCMNFADIGCAVTSMPRFLTKGRQSLTLSLRRNLVVLVDTLYVYLFSAGIIRLTSLSTFAEASLFTSLSWLASESRCTSTALCEFLPTLSNNFRDADSGHSTKEGADELLAQAFAERRFSLDVFMTPRLMSDNEPFISLSELSKHTGHRKGTPTWIGVHGSAYDVTEFLPIQLVLPVSFLHSGSS